MSLYRKYRPKALDDVVGQEHVVTTLRNAVAQDKLAHAYLFAGSRGTGKTSVARILAKAILTRGMEGGTLKRQILEAVDDGSLVDLVEIDAASNRGIDDIRGLVEKIQFTPVAAAAKVYIIDEVHMLTREAFNALLKTLEEPPPYAFFILATTELQKIPATIQSRCQRFTFRHIGEEDIIQRLQHIADQEKMTVDRAALRTIARHAQGGMRDAISLLDQLRSLESVTLEDVQRRIGETGHEYIEGLLRAVVEGDRQAIVTIVGKIEQAGIPLDVFVRQLLGEVRTRLHAAVEAGEDIGAHASLLQSLLSILRDLRIAPIPGLVLEAGLLSLNASPLSVAEEKPRARFFSRTKASTPPAPTSSHAQNIPVKASVPPPADEPEQEQEKEADAALIHAPEFTLDAIRRMWPDLVKRTSPPAVKMSLKNGNVQDVRGSSVILAFPSAFHRDKVAHTDAARGVEESLRSIFKRPVRLECVLEEERRTVPAAKEELVNLAEAASEVF